MGSADTFHYKVLVGMKGISVHARSTEVAQIIHGSSGVKAEIANHEAISELLVAAWCTHPDLIPDEKIMVVLEPEEEHDGGPLLSIRPWEIMLCATSCV